MKFLVDMPLSPMLAAWLRDRCHDAVHASELGLSGATDIAILARAEQDERTVVTADLDYPRLLAVTRTTGPNLMLFRDGQWSEAHVIARMEAVLLALTAAELAQSIIVIDRDRVRRRRLPIEPDSAGR